MPRQSWRRRCPRRIGVCSSVVCCSLPAPVPPPPLHNSVRIARGRRSRRPNIVIMYPDNLGYGEVAIFGGNRGVPTPRIDALAREGMRLTNFNVETFCTPSRAALLTGRYGVRTGTLGYRQPWSGMTLWETTLAELLAPLGYTSALFGKWHAGERRRTLTDQSGLRRVVRHS